MRVGDTVRIVEDEYKELVGLTGTVVMFSDDGTVALVEFDGTVALVEFYIPVWCSVANLEVVE